MKETSPLRDLGVRGSSSSSVSDVEREVALRAMSSSSARGFMGGLMG